MKSLRLAACVLLLPLAGSAQNLLLNAGFESGIIGPSSFGLIPDSCVIDSWNLGFVAFSDWGEVAYVRKDAGAFPTALGFASEGTSFVCITAEGYGRSLYQVFATEPGQVYRASIDIRFLGYVSSGYVAGFSAVDFAATELGGIRIAANETNTFESLDSSAGGWSRYSFDFTATGTGAEVILFATSSAGMDSLLTYSEFDAVSVVAVTAVPEPSAWAALLGMAGLFLAVSHRRRA